jgi:hypothetical protein
LDQSNTETSRSNINPKAPCPASELTVAECGLLSVGESCLLDPAGCNHMTTLLGCSAHCLYLSSAGVPYSGHQDSWGLQCSFDYTLIALPFTLSGAPCRDLDPAKHCLPFQAFLWNLHESLHDSIMLVFCLTINQHHMTMSRSATGVSSICAHLNNGCRGL